MSDTQIIVGLEIGTSKVCVAVGEVSDNQVVNIIGLGQSKSRGVRKGEIVDASLVEEDVRNAIVEAEHMADVEIRSVFLGVSGSHMRGGSPSSSISPSSRSRAGAPILSFGGVTGRGVDSALGGVAGSP